MRHNLPPFCLFICLFACLLIFCWCYQQRKMSSQSLSPNQPTMLSFRPENWPIWNWPMKTEFVLFVYLAGHFFPSPYSWRLSHQTLVCIITESQAILSVNTFSSEKRVRLSFSENLLHTKWSPYRSDIFTAGTSKRVSFHACIHILVSFTLGEGRRRGRCEF